MPDLWTSKQMEGKTATDQAKQAISHTLHRIHENPAVGYHMGFGTQTFGLLTEAAATLWEEPVEKVRKNFVPRVTSNAEAAIRALQEIVAQFEQLNGRECTDDCGRCIRCLARKGLEEAKPQ